MAPEGNFGKPQMELPDRGEAPYSDWPPSPPLGQLPIEVLKPLGPNGKPLEGKELLASLYDLLFTRYGLKKKDAFDANSRLMQGGKARSTTVSEESLVRLLILSLEGKGPTEISLALGVELPDEDELEHDDEVGPSNDLIAQHKHNYLSDTAKEISAYMFHKGRKIHGLISPFIDPATGRESVASIKIEKIRAKLGFDHRAQIFNLASTHLPSVTGKGFYQIDTAINALYHSIVKGESDREIERELEINMPVDHRSKKNTRNPLQFKGNNVAQLRHTVLSKEALSAARKKSYTAEDTLFIAKSLLAGSTYGAITKLLHTPGIKPVGTYGAQAYVYKSGADILSRLSPVISTQLNAKDKTWSAEVAAFLYKYGECSIPEAIAAAERISKKGGRTKRSR